MTVAALPIKTYIGWLQRQPKSNAQKTEVLFEHLQTLDLNEQSEQDRRTIGDTCLLLGARYENLTELGCTPATAAEWLTGEIELGRNQQLETMQALINDLANTHRLALPDLRWERILKPDYDSVVASQQITRRRQQQEPASSPRPLYPAPPENFEQCSTPEAVIEETLSFDSKFGEFPIIHSESVEEFFGIAPLRPLTPVTDIRSAKKKPPAQPS